MINIVIPFQHHIFRIHCLEYFEVKGRSMRKTNDEYTESALQKLSRREKQFGFKMSKTHHSNEKLRKCKKTVSFYNALNTKGKKKKR